MLLKNAGFSDQKTGIIPIFHSSHKAKNFEEESLLHSLHRENHKLSPRTKARKQIISGVSQPGQIQIIVFKIDLIIIKYRKRENRLKKIYSCQNSHFLPKNFEKQIKLTQKSPTTFSFNDFDTGVF